MIRRLCVLFFLQWLIVAQASAQSAISLNDVLPPPPNAAELGKYGNVNVGLTSGTPNISIPLWTLSSRTINVPVSLSYNAANLKVDQIASRVGMNWVLQSGGVVTRTVYGNVDEEATKIKPPQDYIGDRSNTYIDFLKKVTTTRLYDAQSDVFNFSFNDISGRFILDSALRPVFLERSNCKIKINFSPTADWSFKITDAKGMEYYFGGVGATEKTKSLQSACGKSYDQYKPTSWYLKTIIDPGVDTVQFIYKPCTYYYKTAISETATRAASAAVCPCSGSCSSFNSHTTCVQELATEGVILTEILTSTSSKIGFAHITRMDVTNDSLLNKMTIYQRSDNNWIPFKTMNFNYQVVEATDLGNLYNKNDPALRYRPFLNSVRIASADNIIFQDYQFSYEDPAALPKRLSYSQDIWGYFNGRASASTLLYSTDQQSIDNLFSDLSLANRAFSESYAAKGILRKITYPAGGYDSMDYEPNSINTTVVGTAPTVDHAARVVNAQYRKIIVQRDTFKINYVPSGNSLTAALRVFGRVSDPGSTTPHQQAIIKVYDKATSQILYNKTFKEHFFEDANITLLYQHEYIVESSAEAELTEVSSDAIVSYVVGPESVSHQNVIVPGLRIAKTTTVDPVSGSQSVKKYYYASLNDLSTSSGYFVYPVPANFNKFTHILDCPVAGSTSPCSCGDFYTIMSSSMGAIYINPNGPITYGSIVEGYGENFENGGVEHAYQQSAKVQAQTILNGGVISAPYTDISWPGGLELYKHTFKKLPSGSISSVEKVYNTFRMDSRGDVSFENFAVENKFGKSSFSNPPTDGDFSGFNAALYYLKGNWTYLDSSRTVAYSDRGDSLVGSMKYYYENATHMQLTKDVTKDSRASQVTNIYKYPSDKSAISGLTTTASQAIDTLVNRNILNVVIEKESYVGGILQQRTRTNYKNWVAGSKIFVLPQNVEQQTKSNPSEKRVEFFKYDQMGRLLEQSKALDVKMAYIWDYKYAVPVAEVTNADSAMIAYTSFEAENTGNLYLGQPQNILSGDGVTGNKSYPIDGTIARYNLNPSLTYIVSIWTKNGIPNYSGYNGSTQIVANSNNWDAGRLINGWTYREKKFSGVTTINIGGGGGLVDEVRIYPVGSQMTTFTYNPPIGTTSKCDANNGITYYEYDPFGRLLRIRNEDKNILKQYDYQYKVSEPAVQIIASNSTTKTINLTYTDLGSNTNYNFTLAPGSTNITLGTVPQGTYSILMTPVSGSQEYPIIFRFNTGQQTYYSTVVFGSQPLSGSCTVQVSAPPPVQITASNSIGTPVALSFKNMATGYDYNFTVNQGSSNLVMGTIPAGIYQVLLNPATYSSTSPNVYSVYSFSQTYYATVVFGNVQIDSACPISIHK